MTRRFLTQVKDIEVIGAKGVVFGYVEDLVISDGKIDGLVLSVKRSHLELLGMKKPFWSTAQVVVPGKFIRSIGDVVVLKITLEEYASHVALAIPHEESEKDPHDMPKSPGKTVEPTTGEKKMVEMEMLPEKKPAVAMEGEASCSEKKAGEFATPWQKKNAEAEAHT